MTYIKYRLNGIEGDLTIICQKLSQKINNLYIAGDCSALIYELSQMIFPEHQSSLLRIRDESAVCSDDIDTNTLSGLYIATDKHNFEPINIAPN